MDYQFAVCPCLISYHNLGNNVGTGFVKLVSRRYLKSGSVVAFWGTPDFGPLENLLNSGIYMKRPLPNVAVVDKIHCSTHQRRP